MSEHEPLAERLSRFTPDGTGLDRDALLFAAGRASVRPRRAWPALAGALAASQLVTLALLWPRPTGPAPALVEKAPETPAGEIRPLDGSALLALTRRIRQAEAGELPPPPTLDLDFPVSPPLPVLAARPPADLL